MFIVLIIGIILAFIHYVFAPREFEESDRRIINQANKVRNGEIRGEDFEPILHQIATKDLLGWIKVWSIIWSLYVISIAVVYIIETYYPHILS